MTVGEVVMSLGRIPFFGKGSVPLFFAHGPGLGVFVTIGVGWMAVAYGLPVVAWILARRGKKAWGIGVCVISVGASIFALSNLTEISFGLYVFFGLLPLLVSIVVLAKVLRVKTVSCDDEKIQP